MLSDQALMKSHGFALATSVAIDTRIVRTTIVPAVIVLMDARAWWLPRWLDHLLLDDDVEGKRLRRQCNSVPDTVVPTSAWSSPPPPDRAPPCRRRGPIDRVRQRCPAGRQPPNPRTGGTAPDGHGRLSFAPRITTFTT